MKFKKIFNMVMVVLMTVTSLVAYQPVAAQDGTGGATPAPAVDTSAPFVPGEVVVALADAQDKTIMGVVEQAVDTANQQGGEVTRLTVAGQAVINVGDQDVSAAVADLNNDPNVSYAEPNYIYSLPNETAGAADAGYKANSEYVIRHVVPSAETDFKSVVAIPIANLQNMKTRVGATIKATYPNDPYLFQNAGYEEVGATIVWPSTTASANVCELDTGVDSAHKDLVGKIIAGYDFVNADALPTDDNGHGTHIAGIIAAINNNGIGISGVSTGKVVAVKVMDAQGYGTSYDIAQGIYFCAKRADIRIINLSLGSSAYSDVIRDALLFAVLSTTTHVPGQPPGVNGKGKLAVIAAGNESKDFQTLAVNHDIDGDNVLELSGALIPASFPAGYAYYPAFLNRIIAVASSGRLITPPPPGIQHIDYLCQTPTSNFGSWVSVSAPGFDIYSTTPWDIPFYLNYYNSKATRFDYMSGTSMAAAFTSAVAARRWGYKLLTVPTYRNDQVGIDLRDTTLGRAMDGSCTDASLVVKPLVNVAIQLDRGGMNVSAFDSAAGTPLNGATIYAYQGAVSRGSGVVTPVVTLASSTDIDPTRIFMDFKSSTDIINLPVNGGNYTARVNKAGYTVGTQAAYQHEKPVNLATGDFVKFGSTGVPPLSKYFDVVVGWNEFHADSANDPYKGGITWKPSGTQDLDAYLYLPKIPNPLDPFQNNQGKFIVGANADVVVQLLKLPLGTPFEPYGEMQIHPFARLKREGGFFDNGPLMEDITISNRVAVAGHLPANTALPFYAGKYDLFVTDNGVTIDHDNNGGTAEIPLMGSYLVPYVYVWKDGVVKAFNTSVNPSNNGPWPPNGTCNKGWWHAISISSTAAAGPTYPIYTPVGGACDNGASTGFFPYSTDVGPGAFIFTDK